MLNGFGNVKAEATIANLPDGRVWYGSAAAAEYHDFDWLSAHLPADGSVRISSLTNDHDILLLAGPKAREVLQAAARVDCSPEAFGWLNVRLGFVGIAPAVIMAVSYSGEQAFEIHVPNNQCYAAWLALREAGAPHDLRLFGSMAVESMRMEKGYLHWKADLITEFNPFETGLQRSGGDGKEFVGKAALEAMVRAGPQEACLAGDRLRSRAEPWRRIGVCGRQAGRDGNVGRLGTQGRQKPCLCLHRSGICRHRCRTDSGCDGHSAGSARHRAVPL